MSNLTQTRLLERLIYCPDSGLFHWRVSPCWRIRVGSVAGHTGKVTGHVTIRVDGSNYRAHRLAWLYVHGRWPVDQIDHVNGIRHDNRLANLREATGAENNQNRKFAMPNNRSSNLLGVTFDKSCGRWKAQIGKNGRCKNLGHFDSAEAAHATYVAAKRVFHPFSTL